MIKGQWHADDDPAVVTSSARASIVATRQSLALNNSSLWGNTAASKESGTSPALVNHVPMAAAGLQISSADEDMIRMASPVRCVTPRLESHTAHATSDRRQAHGRFYLLGATSGR
jgi:hypothetical protein